MSLLGCRISLSLPLCKYPSLKLRRVDGGRGEEERRKSMSEQSIRKSLMLNSFLTLYALSVMDRDFTPQTDT